MSNESKRRGIDRTAQQLRREIVKNGGRDPGQDKARDRVRSAVLNKEKRR
jgi:hypothetical protein